MDFLDFRAVLSALLMMGHVTAAEVEAVMNDRVFLSGPATGDPVFAARAIGAALERARGTELSDFAG